LERGRIFDMEAVAKILRGRKTILFFDLEATQQSSEVIEIGAVGATVNPDGTIRKLAKGFSCYVKARHPIGHIVTKLTGITQDTLNKQGLIYHEAITRFQKYVSRFKGGVLFASYGNNDIKILEMSAYANFDEGADFVQQIKKNYIDLSAFFGQYIRTEIGNPYSLSNCLKLFDVPFAGTAHDALADAMSLERLYDAFVNQQGVVKELYKQTLSHHHSLPKPVAKVMAELAAGNTVTPERYDEFVAESLK